MKRWLKYGLVTLGIFLVLCVIALYPILTGKCLSTGYACIVPYFILTFPIFIALLTITMGVTMLIPLQEYPFFSSNFAIILYSSVWIILSLAMWFGIGAIIGLITSKIKKDGN